MKWHAILVIALGAAACALAQAPEQDHPRERQEYFYEQRRFPRSQIPAGARLQAIRALDRVNQTVRGRRPAPAAEAAALNADSAGQWHLVGPQPTTYPGASRYLTSGRVTALAVDPRSSDIAYAGGAEGGVWKTTDGGQTWTPITDDQPSLATGSIAIDPTTADTVYVGTGEENFAQDSYYGAGILKSTDGGATWTNIVGPFLRKRIGGLAVHPSNGQILLAATDTAGVYRSTDGGLNWTLVLSGGTTANGGAATSILFDPTNGDVAWAAIGNTGGGKVNGVYRSSDAGATWTFTNGTAPQSLPSTNVGRIELAIAPSSTNTLYAGIQSSAPGSAFGSSLGIYKTIDGGQTWTKLSSAPDYCSPQCWYDMTIRVHPINADIVIAGGLYLTRTMDGGATWRSLPQISNNGIQIHVDQHAQAYSADGTRLYVGNDGGVWSTAGAQDPVVFWTNLNQTLALTQFYPGHSIHPVDPGIGLGGTQDNGTQRYTAAPNWDGVTCGDGGWTAIDVAVPTVSFTTCQYIDIRRTLALTGSSSWTQVIYGIDQNDRQRFIPAFVMDPTNPLRLYFGTQRLYQTVDGAGRWRPISGDLTRGSSLISAIRVAPGDSNTVYVGTLDGKVQVTNNAGDGSQARWTDRTNGLPRRAVTQVMTDPVDSATVYVTFSGFTVAGDPLPGHIYKSTDGGATWNDISGNLPNIPVNDLVVDPDLPSTLYVGTDIGVLATTDGGNNWSTLGSGLPNVVVVSLVLHRPSRTLRAATHGRSAWDFSLGTVSGSPSPVITAISPSAVQAGDPGFTLTISGSNFGPGTKVLWNGQDRQVTQASSTSLSVQIPATDIAGVDRVAIVALSPVSGGGISNVANLTIGPDPTMDDGGLINAAYPTGGQQVAPGSIASLYGHNFAGSLQVADLVPLPFTLGGVTVTMNERSVPLLAVSPRLINFQVPWNIGVGQATVVVSQGTRTSAVARFQVVPFAPGIFSMNQQGTGQGAVRIAGTATIPAPVGTFSDSKPVPRNGFIEVYCTGLGPVRFGQTTGSPPSNVLTDTVQPAAATVGGLPANVTFSGLVAGTVGLYVVDVQIPDSAPSGDAVPVTISVGGLMSNSVTIAIE